MDKIHIIPCIYLDSCFSILESRREKSTPIRPQLIQLLLTIIQVPTRNVFDNSIGQVTSESSDVTKHHILVRHDYQQLLLAGIAKNKCLFPYTNMIGMTKENLKQNYI